MNGHCIEISNMDVIFKTEEKKVIVKEIKIDIKSDVNIDLTKTSYGDLDLDSFYELGFFVQIDSIQIYNFDKIPIIDFEFNQGSRIGLKFWERHRSTIICKINKIKIKNDDFKLKLNKIKFSSKGYVLIVQNIDLIIFHLKLNPKWFIIQNKNVFNFNNKFAIKINNFNIIIGNCIDDNKDHIIININEIKLKYLESLVIKDIEILDRVIKSKWNKLLCKDLTKNNFKYFCYLLYDHNKNTLELSIHPIRLFINQYTIIFLLEWFKEFNLFDNNLNGNINFGFNIRLVDPLSITLDYKPVKFNTGIGVTADLINLFPIQNLHLKFHPDCADNVNKVIEIWQGDIINSGISLKYLKSIMIVNSLSLMLSGLTDVFIRPYDSLQRDGISGLIPGMRQGLWSFIEKLVNGSCDIVSRITISASSVLDTSQHYIYPSAVPLQVDSKFSNQPNNLSDGLSDAYKTLTRELKDTGNIVILPFDGNHSLGDGLVAFGQSVPILILKPVSASLFSLSKIILGLRNTTDYKQKIIMDQKYSI
jgi:hypothetical protein